MIKNFLYLVLVIIIVSGATYSYKKLNFGSKTTVLFKEMLSEEGGKGKAPGDRSKGKAKRGKKGGKGKSKGGKKGDKGKLKGGKKGGPRDGGRPIISLRNVIPYGFILAFFVLITRFLDVRIRKGFRSKPPS